jgi:hypothetical protein
MTWLVPIDFRLLPTRQRDREVEVGQTQLPMFPHPGAFASPRKHDVHTGVDLYCPEGTVVRAVEAGVVISIENFTGPDSDPPTPWWLPTQAVLVEGESGVIVYGEIATFAEMGMSLKAGDMIGAVRRVLRNDKGYPMSMLHLELHAKGTKVSSPVWDLKPGSRPETLRDPTLHLLQAIGKGP